MQRFVNYRPSITQNPNHVVSGVSQNSREQKRFLSYRARRESREFEARISRGANRVSANQSREARISRGANRARRESIAPGAKRARRESREA